MSTAAQTIAALQAQVGALTSAVEALTALVGAKAAPKAARAASPAQVMWKTRTAGTCPDCGRADFRTVRGFATHALSAAGVPCAVTPERVAAAQ